MIELGQHQGDRDYQEDSVWAEAQSGSALLIVADGLGGHAAGDMASRLIIESVRSELARNPLKELSVIAANQFFSAVLGQYQSRLMDENSAVAEAHTTLALAMIRDEQLLTLTVGDSRVYHLSGGDLWRTKDHSVIQMLRDDGEITEDEMRTHPDQSKLYRSIGPSKEVKPRLRLRSFRPSDRVLICSDGFWEAFSELQIKQFMSSVPKPDVVAAVDQAALNCAPKADNVSAVVYWDEARSADSAETQQQAFKNDVSKQQWRGTRFVVVSLALLLIATVIVTLIA